MLSSSMESCSCVCSQTSLTLSDQEEMFCDEIYTLLNSKRARYQFKKGEGRKMFANEKTDIDRELAEIRGIGTGVLSWWVNFLYYRLIHALPCSPWASRIIISFGKVLLSRWDQLLVWWEFEIENVFFFQIFLLVFFHLVSCGRKNFSQFK